MPNTVDTTEMEFATFNLNGKRATGIIIKRNKLTVAVEPVNFEHSMILNRDRIVRSHRKIMRHVTKDQVVYWPKGVIPKS